MTTRSQEAPQELLAQPGLVFFAHPIRIIGAALGRTGAVLVALDEQGFVTGWNPSTGERLYSRQIFGPGSPPRRLICSPDSRLIALTSLAVSRPETVFLEAATGKVLRWMGSLFSPVFSSDGGIVSGSDGPAIRRFRGR